MVAVYRHEANMVMVKWVAGHLLIITVYCSKIDVFYKYEFKVHLTSTRHMPIPTSHPTIECPDSTTTVLMTILFSTTEWAVVARPATWIHMRKYVAYFFYDSWIQIGFSSHV